MSTIFDFITEQETAFGQEIEVEENWSWCMKDHIRTSLLMKHGKFISATNDLKVKQPFKNIVYPNLNLRYRSEDIDLKDVVLYVDEPENNHLSFLVKKYHDDVYAREHNLDALFDDLKEEKIDYGGTLVRRGKDGPIIETLESIAFCDQTDMLSGPIGFKMFFSPDELLETTKLGWGEELNGADISLKDLVFLAEKAKQQDKDRLKTKTPGKYIEVYRVHGSLPASWLAGRYKIDESKERFIRQIQIVAFYPSETGRKGVTLYRAKEFESPFKIHLASKKIRNRALGLGGVEELFDSQLWTNFGLIKKKEQLDAAKVLLQTTDPTYANKNKLKDMQNLQVTTVQEGKSIGIVPTINPANINVLQNWIEEWDQHGQRTSGATDALLGERPTSGTPFRLENLVANLGQGLHEYRKGKFALFIAEIYTDWIIPDIKREIVKGVTFLASLTPDEMEYVTDCIVRHKVNEFKLTRILNGEVFLDQEVANFEREVREDFSKGGNKKFVEIIAGEFDNKPIAVKVNVAGKQKDLAGLVDKYANIMRFVFSTYNSQTGSFAALEDPKMVKLLSKMNEYSGLDPVDFGYSTSKSEQPVPAKIPVPA